MFFLITKIVIFLKRKLRIFVNIMMSVFTMSRTMRRILLFTAVLLTIWSIDRINESAR